MDNDKVSRKQLFDTVMLYNVLPPSSSLTWEPQCRLFQGKMCVSELINKKDDMPWYQIKFDWDADDEEKSFFCQTGVIKCTKNFNATIEKREEWFKIMMECSNGKHIPLELRIRSPIEEQMFNDLLFRIREEYEMIDDMLGSSNDSGSEFGEFVGFP
ncbi:LAFE_0F01332g1_1 [Lachancea fermentati]|uniref:LAFE_0F01332g1_1 n=1 Tax=Lachancea fermentati TaxID=4955 RepID=A0A1G4MEC4_LACFM|nr:LAFE_0F01332g1_1 [Lachancea fermentati]